MGKKKKGAKKKKKKRAPKKGKGSSALADLDDSPLVPAHLPIYATIHCKLVNWVFLDFTLKDVCLENTRLFSIKRKIKARHGRISNLRVYLGTMQPQTELKDEMATLEELGVEGLPLVNPVAMDPTALGPTPTEVERKEVVLYYDFTPHQHEDPLLLHA